MLAFILPEQIHQCVIVNLSIHFAGSVKWVVIGDFYYLIILLVLDIEKFGII